jgi:hypothetical protein
MDREREGKGARGIHTSGARPKDQMPPPERIEEVRDAVKRFAIVNAGHAIQSVEGMGGPKVVASSRYGAPKTERGLIARNSEEGLSGALLKVMLSSLSQNVPSLKDCTAIGPSTYERVMKCGEPNYSRVSEEVLGHIEELLEKWGVVLGGLRSLYGDGEVGVCGVLQCCAAAKTFVGYNTSDLTSTDCVAVFDELLPVCKKCADKYKSTQNAERRTKQKALDQVNAQNAELRAQTALSGGRVQNPEPSPEPRGDDVETEVVVTEGDLLNVVKYKEDIARMTITECDEMLKNWEWKVVKDAEDFLAVIKDLDKVRTELAVKDAEIQDLKDERRDLEEQLEEALDNSDDKAQAITAGANIMMAEQHTQTQQNYADLRQYIDQIRAEHAAFVLEAQRADAATAASSQELERVLSDLSDETYKTAKSTYDSSDEPEPE